MIEVVLTTISIILEEKLNVIGSKLSKIRKISYTLAARLEVVPDMQLPFCQDGGGGG